MCLGHSLTGFPFSLSGSLVVLAVSVVITTIITTIRAGLFSIMEWMLRGKALSSCCPYCLYEYIGCTQNGKDVMNCWLHSLLMIRFMLLFLV